MDSIGAVIILGFLAVVVMLNFMDHSVTPEPRTTVNHLFEHDIRIACIQSGREIEEGKCVLLLEH